MEEQRKVVDEAKLKNSGAKFALFGFQHVILSTKHMPVWV
jgi:hypothetical protein